MNQTVVQRLVQAGFLGQGKECARADVASVRSNPAGQRFGADQLSGLHVELGLEPRDDVLIAYRIA